MGANQVIVVGAGASGLMAAARAAETGAQVLALEQMELPGKKLLISGKCRCNLTNAADLSDFIAAYGPNGPFLYNVFHHFFRDELLVLLKRYGVETKVERGGRIFPASDKAEDVVEALKKYMSDFGARLKTGIRVRSILTDNAAVTGLKTDGAVLPAGAVILATGGASYPATGSTGEGYRIAEALGHSLVKLRPGLVPLVVHEVDLAKSMQGVSLRNVGLTAYKCEAAAIESSSKKSVIEIRQGEMLFTHFGIGGPITLLMSLAVVRALENGTVSVAIDLKPALDLKQSQQRLQRDFDQYPQRGLHNILKELLPLKMIEPLIQLSGIDPYKPGSQVSQAERNRLAQLLKSLRFNIKNSLPLSSAMVTAGGVSLKEIDPRTMASRFIKGLYFCGEIIDIDADTGGYNLQAAFSTGYVAGENAARYLAAV